MSLKIIALALATVVTTVGCASLENKTVAAAGTVSAVKIESSGSSSTGTPTPNILLGGAAFAIATTPVDADKPVFVEARRHSLISRIFNLGVSDSATIYIGSKGESADDTVKRLTALRSDASIEPDTK